MNQTNARPRRPASEQVRCACAIGSDGASKPDGEELLLQWFVDKILRNGGVHSMLPRLENVVPEVLVDPEHDHPRWVKHVLKGFKQKMIELKHRSNVLRFCNMLINHEKILHMKFVNTVF